MFDISKRTLIRWQEKTPWGIPFPAPAFGSNGGSMKRYLTQEVMDWELKCQDIEDNKKMNTKLAG